MKKYSKRLQTRQLILQTLIKCSPILREKQKANRRAVAESYNKNYSTREVAILARDFPVVKELIFEHPEIFKDAIKIFYGLQKEMLRRWGVKEK